MNLSVSIQQKSAKDIANEMLKWAKKQEKATKVQMSLKPLVKPLETKSAFDSSHGAAANVAHKMLEKSHVGVSRLCCLLKRAPVIKRVSEGAI